MNPDAGDGFHPEAFQHLNMGMAAADQHQFRRYGLRLSHFSHLPFPDFFFFFSMALCIHRHLDAMRGQGNLTLGAGRLQYSMVVKRPVIVYGVPGLRMNSLTPLGLCGFALSFAGAQS